jgi:hypothetical protein
MVMVLLLTRTCSQHRLQEHQDWSADEYDRQLSIDLEDIQVLRSADVKQEAPTTFQPLCRPRDETSGERPRERRCRYLGPCAQAEGRKGPHQRGDGRKCLLIHVGGHGNHRDVDLWLDLHAHEEPGEYDEADRRNPQHLRQRRRHDDGATSRTALPCRLHQRSLPPIPAGTTRSPANDSRRRQHCLWPICSAGHHSPHPATSHVHAPEELQATTGLHTGAMAWRHQVRRRRKTCSATVFGGIERLRGKEVSSPVSGYNLMFVNITQHGVPRDASRHGQGSVRFRFRTCAREQWLAGPEHVHFVGEEAIDL